MKLNGKIIEKDVKTAVNGNSYYPLKIQTQKEVIQTSTFDKVLENFEVGDHIEFDLVLNEKNGKTYKNISNVVKYLGEVSTQPNTFASKDRMDLMEDDIKNIHIELARIKILLSGEGAINIDGEADEDSEDIDGNSDEEEDKADDASDEDEDASDEDVISSDMDEVNDEPEEESE